MPLLALVLVFQGCGSSSEGDLEGTVFTDPIGNAATSVPSTPTSIKLYSPNKSPANDRTPTLIVGGLKNGYYVNIYKTSSCSSVIKSVKSTGSSMKVTLSTLPAGSYKFYAKQKNGSLLSKCKGYAAYVLDYAAPETVNVTFPLDGATVGATPNLSGTCEDGATIYFEGDVSEASSTTCTGGIFNFALPLSAGSGAKSIQVTQIDAAGNASGAVELNLVRDDTPPTVTINQSASQADPTNSSNISFDVVFSKVIDPDTFSALDISNFGSASGVIWDAPITTDNITWTITTSSIATNGSIIPAFFPGVVTDFYGNGNLSSTSSDGSVTYDTSVPDVSIGNPSTSSLSSGNIDYSVTYSGATSINLTPADITVNTAGTVGYSVSILDGTTSSPTIRIAITGGDGIIDSIVIAGGTSQNLAGNFDAGASQGANVNVDNTAPSVVIGTPSLNAISTGAITYGVNYSGASTVNLTSSNVTVNTTGSVTYSKAIVDGTTFSPSILITITGGNGTIDSISIAAGTSTDAVGLSDAGASQGTDVTVDNDAPSLSIGAPSAISINTGNIDYAVTYSNADSVNLTSGNVTVNTTGSVTFTKSIIGGTSINPTIRINVTSGDGTIDSIVIAPGTSTDTVGNADSGASQGTDVTVDNDAPSLSIGAPSTTLIGMGNVDYAVNYIGSSTVNLTSGNITVDTTGSVSYSVSVIDGTTAAPIIRISILGGDGSISGLHIAAGTSSDAVGNADSGAHSLTPVSVDNDAPSIVIGSPSVSNISTGDVDYAVTYTGASTINLSAGNVTVNTTGTVAFTKSIIGGTTATPTIRLAVTGGDGVIDSVIIAAGTATDIAGNSDSGAGQGMDVTVDNSAPVISINTLGVINNANRNAYSFSGTCSENGETVNLTAPIAASATCASGAFSFANLDVSAEADGSVTFTVNTVDASNNSSSNSGSAVKDTSSPTILIGTLPTINNANKNSYSLSGSCSENGQTVHLTAPLTDSATCSIGSFTFSNLDVSSFADGSISFTVDTVDAAGNTSNHTDTTTKDTSAPSVSIDAPSVSTINVGDVDYVVTYTNADSINLLASNVTITTTGTVTYSKSVIAGTTTSPTIRVTVTGGDGTIDSVVIASGTSNDTAGNADAGANQGTDVAVDNTLPTVVIGAPTTTSLSTGNVDYAVTYSGATVINLVAASHVTVNTTGTVTYSKSVIAGTTTTPTIRITVTGGDGTIDSISIAAASSHDDVGNLDTGASQATDVSVDNSNPTISIGTLTVINNANKAAYGFSGACSENGQTVNLTSPITASTTCATGSFTFSSLNVSGETDGSVTFTVSTTDAVGNTGSDSASITKDTSDPLISIDGMNDIGNSNKNSYSFTGTCSENGVAVNLTAPITSSATCTSGAFSFSGLNVSGEADGTVTFTVTITDAAGNTGTHSTIADKDTLDPTVSIGSPSTTSLNTGTVDYAVTYTGATVINLVAASHVTVNTTGTVTYSKSVIAGTTATPTIRITVTGGDGTIDSIVIATGSSHDDVGNLDAGTTQGTDVTVDNSAPTVSIGTPSTVILNTGNVDYAVTYTGTSSVNLASGNVTVDTTGAVSYSVTIINGTTTTPTLRVVISGGDGSISGVHIAAATSSDSVGNTDAGASSLTPVIVDNDAPAVVIGAPNVTAINTGNVDYAVTYTGADGVISLNAINVTVNTTGTVTYSKSIIGGSTATPTIRINVTGGDGIIDSVAIAAGTSTDTAGNSDAGASQGANVNVDNTDPTINIGALSVINNTNKTSYAFSGTCSENGQTINLTAPIAVSTTCASGAFNFSSLDVSGQADGTVTFTVSTSDLAGNTVTDSDTAAKDTAAPTAAINALSLINNSNKTSYAFSGTCTANGDTVTITAPASISGTATCASGAFSFTNKDVSAEADGTVTFTVSINDAAGNTASASASTTMDSVDPTIAISALSVINNANKTSYGFAGTCSENGQAVTITAPASISGTTTCASGAFSFSGKNVSSESDGSVTFTVSISDAAGNTATNSSIATKDTLDPTVALSALSLINNANKNTYAFSGTCSANGDTVTITAPASISGTATCTSGAFSFSGKNVSGETDGSVTFTVSIGDTAGNTATDSSTATKDTSDPTIAISTLSAINNTNKAAYGFSGTCSENGQTVTITAPSSISGTTTCASGAFSFTNKDASTEVDGSVTFSVSISDVAGNTTTNSSTVTKDTSDPTISISALSFINNANKTSYNFSGTCSENGETVTITAPASISGSTTCASGAFSFSGKNVSGEADGTVTFTVSMSDAAGNTGTGSNTASKDTVDPTATISALSVINNTNKTSYGFTGTCTANGDTVTITAPASISGTTACASGAFSFSGKNVSAEADGSVTFTVSIADTAGNTTTDSSSATKDTSNPTVAISTMTLINNANKASYAFSGTCSENGQTVTITAPASISGTATCASNAFSFSGKDVSAEADGTVTFTVSTVDTAGNTGTGSNSATKDTSNPTIAISAMSTINNANKNSYNFSGTCSENGQTVTITAPASISGTATCASGAFSFSGKDVSAEADGTVTFTVSTVDTAGNTGTGSNTTTKDTVDPAATINTLSVINNTNKASYAFSGTCSENGQTVTITAPASISGTATCASGAFSFSGKDVSAEADGTVTFTVSAVDAAGNTGTGSSSITKDTSNPTVAISTMSIINNANKTSYGFAGTCSENGQTVTITAPASVSGTATCTSGAFSFSGKDVSAEADGSVTFTVSIADAAGNTGTGSNTATKDTVDPTVTIGTPSVSSINIGNVDYAVTYTGTSSVNLLATNVTVNVTGTVTYSKSIIAGTTTTPTVRIAVTGGDGTIDSVVIAAGTSTDSAGNSDAGNTQAADVTVDNTAPTINIGAPSTTLVNTGNVDYAITYTGASSVNLTSGNVTVNTTGAVSYSVTIINGTTTTPTLRVVVSGGDGSITDVQIAAATSSDAVGNTDVGASSLTTVIVDNDAPVVVIGAPSVSSINTGNVDYAVTYTGANNSISLNAINVTVTTTGTVTYSKSVIGGATATPTIRIAVTGGDGIIDAIAIAAGTSTDTAGNSDAGASQGANVDVDNTDPAIAISTLNVINNANKTSYGFSGTCSENGQTVTITAPASISGTTTCSSGAFSFSGKDVSGEADGTVTFTVSTSDGAGNVGTGSNTATKDTINPAIAISTMSTINNANKATYSFAGICSENGQTITITAPASIAGSTTTCSSLAFSFSNKDVSAEADGTLTFTVSTVDAAGNTGTGSNTATKDAAVPTIAISTMSTINNANKTSYAFAGTCSENGKTVTITAPASIAGGTSVCTTGAFSFSGKDVSAESDGTVTFTVSITDAAGNTGTGSNTASKDTANPTVAISTMTAINNTNKTSYAFSGTCSENGQAVTITAPSSISGTITCSGGTFSFTGKNVSSETDGTVTFTVSTVDAAGNTGTGSNTAAKDTVVPTVAISTMSAINNTNKTSYSFSGTCTANGDTVAITAPAGVTGSTTCASGAFSFSGKDVSASSDGTVTFTVSATDAAGNTVSASNTATKDVVVPTIAISTMSTINNANKASYGFSGTCSANGDTITITAPASISGTTTCASGAFSFTGKNVTAETDGSVTFTVSIADAVGNIGTGSNTATKDTANPTVAISTMSTINNANKASYAFAGTCSENGRTVTITAPTSIAGGTATCTSNAFSFSSKNVTAETDGTVTFTVSTTDVAGNTGTGSNTATKDTANPTVAISTMTAINNANKASYAFAGTCSENGQTVTITAPASISGTATCTTGAFSFSAKNVTAETDGTVTFTVSTVDTAGNTGTGSNTATKDTANPTVAISTMSAINNTNKASYAFAGTCSENGRTVTITAPISIAGGTATCTTGAFSFSAKNVTSETDGTVTFTVSTTDAAGNTGTGSNTATKDVVVPTVAISAMSAINNANKASYSFSGTCTANGDTIAITAPASISGSTTCASGAFSFSAKNVTSESDGTVTFTVSATDAVGNSATGSNTASKDNTNPTVAISTMTAINNANKAAYGFSGTCSENGQLVTITAPASISGTATCTTGTFSFSSKNVTTETDGTVTFTVSTVDAAGNTGSGSNTATKDTVVPTVAISTMSTINNANKTSYSFSGTCTANGDTIAITAPAGVTGSTTCATGTFSFTGKNVSGPTDGTVTFTVSATDAVGNSATASNTATKDTVNPTVAISTMTAINNANKAAYGFSGTCSENGQLVTITAPTSIVGGTATCTSNAFSFSSKNVTAETDGTVTFTVSTVDAAGNSGTGSNTALKDVVVPTITINALTAINNANKTSYSFSGTCTANGDTIAITAPAVTGTATCTAGVYAISSINMTSIPDGAVNFTVTITDAAGNTGTGSNSTTKDIVAPSITGIALSNPATSPGNDTTPTLSVTGVFPVGDNFQLYTDATCTSSASSSTAASGANSVLVTTTTLSTNQTYTFYAKGTDAAGNTSCSGAGVSVTYDLDTAVPTVSISAPGYINNGNKTAYTFSGTCSANGDTITITAPAGVTGSTTCSSSAFSFTKDFSSQADGSVTISVQASDGAGNTATDSKVATKDTVNPTITNGTINFITPTNQAAYSFSGTCSENSQTVTLSSPVSATTTCTTGAFTFSNLNLSALAEGNNTFTTTISDAAGNTGSDSDTGVKDTVVPTTPACVSVATNGVPSKSNTQTWTGSTDATSGVNYYEMSLGISAAADTVAWTSVGASVTPYQFTGISPVLLYETLYRFYIRTRDNAGNISAVATCTQWELKRGYGVFKGTSTTNSATLNQATSYALQYSADSYNAQYFTHSTSTNSQNITINYAGNYILSSSIPVYRTTTNTGVGSLTATVKVNGTAVNKGFAANSFTGGSITSPRGSGSNMSIMLENLAVNDVITIETVNNALATEVLTVPSGKQFSTVLEYVPAENQVFTGTGTTLVGATTNFNPTASTKILWTESIKGSNYTHSNSTNPENITIAAAGNYLVSVNVPTTGAIAGAKATTSIFVGGSISTTNNATSTIDHSAFISNSNGHITTSANYTNIIYGVTAGQVLDVRQIATTAGTLTMPAGKVASIYIQKLDTSSEYYIANGAATSWNTAAAVNVTWTTDKAIDTSIFTHSTSTNPQNITALSAGDYMLFFSDYITSTTAYTNPIVYVLINGVATPVGVCKAHHNFSTTALRPATCNLQTMLTLSANDVISMTTIRDVTTGTASNSGVPRLTIRKISN